MRSRLEARWAALFDLIGWRWTYEPFDADGYIPDFLIEGDAPFLAEIGQCVTYPEYISKGEKARRAFPTQEQLVGEAGDTVRYWLPERYVVVLGLSPLLREANWRASAAGVLAHDLGDNGLPAPAWWDRCAAGHIGLWTMSPTGMWPCGHPWNPSRFDDDDLLRRVWGEAGSQVQWQPR